MSRENFYDLRKQYRDASRQTEREYSESVTEPIARELGRAELRLSRGVQGLLTDGISGAVEGFMRPEQMQNMQTTEPASVPRPSVLGMNMSSPTEQPKDIVISPETQNAAIDMVTNPVNLMGAGFASSVMQAMPRNLRTMIPGFYRGPVDQMKGVTQESARAFPYAMQEALSPTAAATARQYGTGMGRRAEQINPVDEKGKISPSVRQGNMMASPYMAQQARGASGEFGDTVVESMPTFRNEVLATGNMADDAALKKVLAEEGDIPQDVVDRAARHVKAVHGTDSGTVVARRKAAAGSQLGEEAAGRAKGTAPEIAKMLSSSKTLQAYKDYAGDTLGEAQLREYLGIINAITQRAGKTWTGRNALSDAFYQGEKRKSLKSSYLAETYWKAKARQKKGLKIQKGGPQEEALKFVNGYIAKHPITINKMDDGKLVLQQSFKSSAKDLGGMNAFVVVDPKSQEFYTMLSDGHDLFGMTPPGWSDLTTVLPIQRRRIGDKEAARGSETQNLAAKEARQSAVADLERASGMQMMPRESVKAFEDRVARDFRAAPTARDRTRAVSNQVGALGMLTGGNREEQQQ